jgi:hypothetical protein
VVPLYHYRQKLNQGNYLAANLVIKLLPLKVKQSSLKIFFLFFLAVDEQKGV